MSLNDPTPSTYGSNLGAETELVNHDLVVEGNATLTVPVYPGAHKVVLAAHSDDGNSFSASITWTVAGGNVTQEQSKGDLDFSSVTEGAVDTKVLGDKAKITFTDESGGANNRINAHVQIEK